MPEAVSTLLRFRLHCKAIVRDGSKAFLQLVLMPDDRDVTRSFWFKVEHTTDGTLLFSDEVCIYCFVRLPFGLECSLLLIATALRHLATAAQDRYLMAAQKLDKSLQTDDFSGCDEDTGLLTLYTEITAVMAEVQLPMSKSASNSITLHNFWQNVPFNLDTRILGVNWDTVSDRFFTDIQEIVQHSSSKRLILQTADRLYDPLGLFHPVSISNRILCQDAWSNGLQWDELLLLDMTRHGAL